MKKIRVLIADDIKENINRLEKILVNVSNVEIVGKVSNGEEEIKRIIELQPELVLTDNQMPKLNGIEVVEKIRNEYKEKFDIDFIIITADRNLTQKAIQLDVFSIINKPYEDSKIIDVINEYINFVNYSKENIKNNNIDNKSKNLFEKIFHRRKK